MNLLILAGQIAVYILAVMVLKKIWNMIDISKEMQVNKSQDLLPVYLSAFAHVLLYVTFLFVVYSLINFFQH